MVAETLSQNGVRLIKAPTIENELKFENESFELKDNNQHYFFDAIIVCTGAKPNIQMALDAGIYTRRGILVDDYFQTSVPNIFAAGNVAELANSQTAHLWHEAESQGLCAGKNMAGIALPYQPKPFRLKTEIFGLYIFS